MPRTRRRFGRRFSKVIDNKIWSTTIFGGSTVGSGTSSDLGNLLLNAETTLGHNIYDATVLRVRGNLLLHSPAASTPGDLGVLTLGILVADDDLAAGGNLPEPDQDQGDWLYRASFPFAVHADQPGSTSYPVIGGHIPVDNKSMRRIENAHQGLHLVAIHDGGLASNPTLNGALHVLVGLR